MSRYYRMLVAMSGIAADKEEAIKEAMACEWGFHRFSDASGGLMFATGEDSLSADTLEEEFASQIAGVIWEANGGKCWVEVTAYCLDECPYREYEPSYEEWLAETKRKHNAFPLLTQRTGPSGPDRNNRRGGAQHERVRQ